MIAAQSPYLGSRADPPRVAPDVAARTRFNSDYLPNQQTVRHFEPDDADATWLTRHSGATGSRQSPMASVRPSADLSTHNRITLYTKQFHSNTMPGEPRFA